MKEVVRSSENLGRFLIQFSKYADVAVPDAWKGWRNPVRYATLEEVGIDLNTLKFKPMPLIDDLTENVVAETESNKQVPFMLTICRAKERLANTFGVKPDDIEIIIRA